MKLRNLHNGHLFAAAAFLTPTLAVYLSGFLTPLLIVMALALCGLSFRQNAKRLKISWIGAAFFLVLALWGGVSAFWSIAPERSLTQALDLLSLGACGLVLLAGARTLAPQERRGLGPALLAGLGIAALFMTAEVATSQAIYRLDHPMWGENKPLNTIFNRWTTVFALLVWPVLLLTRQKFRPWLAGAVLVLSFAVLVQLENSSSLVGFVLGVAAFFLSLRFPKRATIAFICLVMVGTALAPRIPLMLPDPKTLWTEMPGLSTSLVHRLYVWRFVAERIEERPFLGWGLDTGRDMPGRTRIIWNVGEGGEALPLHPHNAALQWWMEIGLFGAVIGGLFMVWAFVMVLRRRMERFPNAIFNGAMMTGIAIASLGYGIWQAWWLATLFLTAALLVSMTGENDPPPKPTP